MLKLIKLISIIILLSSCGVVNAPKEAAVKRKALMQDCYGSYFFKGPRLEGELLAVDKDTVFILSFDNGLIRFHKNSIDTATIILHQNNANKMGLIGAGIGAVNTILLSTAAESVAIDFITPVAGLLAGGAEYKNRKNYLTFPQDRWSEISKFARFPQGMPEGLDRSQLVVKTRVR